MSRDLNTGGRLFHTDGPQTVKLLSSLFMGQKAVQGWWTTVYTATIVFIVVGL